MTFRATIMGCGSSGGVPRVGAGWGVCDPSNPKNRRRRCSLLVERIEGTDKTSLVVDTGPDIREQLLEAKVSWLDGVLYSHEHADHTHGIDDMRVLAIHQRRMIEAYADTKTEDLLRLRFGYCFETPAGSQYPPILSLRSMEAKRSFSVQGAAGGIQVCPFTMHHGDIDALGFRFGSLAYSSDVNGLPKSSIELLSGIDIWIVDALRFTPHPSHWSVGDALSWIDTIKPRRAILTNLHTDLDYERLRAELPPHVEPAFDGMVIDFEGSKEW